MLDALFEPCPGQGGKQLPATIRPHGSNLLSDVARHIRREALLKAKEPVRVAVSGGIDSMVLLDGARLARPSVRRSSCGSRPAGQ